MRKIHGCWIVVVLLVSLLAGAAQGSKFHTDPPAVTKSTSQDLTVLHKELGGYGNYGSADGRSDILYSTESDQWIFDLSKVSISGSIDSADVVVGLVLDDHYGSEAANYVGVIAVNGTEVFSGSFFKDLEVPHGAPFGKKFENWKEASFKVSNLTLGENTISIGNRTPGRVGGDWIAIDYIQLRLHTAGGGAPVDESWRKAEGKKNPTVTWNMQGIDFKIELEWESASQTHWLELMSERILDDGTLQAKFRMSCNGCPVRLYKKDNGSWKELDGYFPKATWSGRSPQWLEGFAKVPEGWRLPWETEGYDHPDIIWTTDGVDYKLVLDWRPETDTGDIDRAKTCSLEITDVSTDKKGYLQVKAQSTCDGWPTRLYRKQDSTWQLVNTNKFVKEKTLDEKSRSITLHAHTENPGDQFKVESYPNPMIVWTETRDSQTEQFKAELHTESFSQQPQGMEITEASLDAKGWLTVDGTATCENCKLTLHQWDAETSRWRLLYGQPLPSDKTFHITRLLPKTGPGDAGVTWYMESQKFRIRLPDNPEATIERVDATVADGERVYVLGRASCDECKVVLERYNETEATYTELSQQTYDSSKHPYGVLLEGTLVKLYNLEVAFCGYESGKDGFESKDNMPSEFTATLKIFDVNGDEISLDHDIFLVDSNDPKTQATQENCRPLETITLKTKPKWFSIALFENDAGSRDSFDTGIRYSNDDDRIWNHHWVMKSCEGKSLTSGTWKTCDLSLNAATTDGTTRGVQRWYVKEGDKERKTCETGDSSLSFTDRVLYCYFDVDDLGSAESPDTSKQTWYTFMPQGNYPEWVVKFYDWDELTTIKDTCSDWEDRFDKSYVRIRLSVTEGN